MKISHPLPINYLFDNPVTGNIKNGERKTVLNYILPNKYILEFRGLEYNWKPGIKYYVYLDDYLYAIIESSKPLRISEDGRYFAVVERSLRVEAENNTGDDYNYYLLVDGNLRKIEK